MIPDYVKDQIKERDIVSIIQDEGVELKREGSHYKCCCPFDGEKTPSFVVTPLYYSAVLADVAVGASVIPLNNYSISQLQLQDVKILKNLL